MSQVCVACGMNGRWWSKPTSGPILSVRLVYVASVTLSARLARSNVLHATHGVCRSKLPPLPRDRVCDTLTIGFRPRHATQPLAKPCAALQFCVAAAATAACWRVPVTDRVPLSCAAHHPAGNLSNCPGVPSPIVLGVHSLGSQAPPRTHTTRNTRPPSHVPECVMSRAPGRLGPPWTTLGLGSGTRVS